MSWSSSGLQTGVAAFRTVRGASGRDVRRAIAIVGQDRGTFRRAVGADCPRDGQFFDVCQLTWSNRCRTRTIP
jgi:hypothetical protein